jgi:hypothetical protein
MDQCAEITAFLHVNHEPDFDSMPTEVAQFVVPILAAHWLGLCWDQPSVSPLLLALQFPLHPFQVRKMIGVRLKPFKLLMGFGYVGRVTESKFLVALKLGPEATLDLASSAALDVQGTFSAQDMDWVARVNYHTWKKKLNRHAVSLKKN